MNNKHKIWLVGMSGPNSYDDLFELIQPIKEYFNGIVWVLHDSQDSNESKYLEAVKGEGKIIHYYFHKRHDESRNQALWCGPIKPGDWCCQIDTLERIPVSFAQKIPEIIRELEDLNVDVAHYFGKPYLFKYDECMKYSGSPHECLASMGRQLSCLELNQIFKDENETRINVRPTKRPDKFHFVLHYLNYFLYPYGSNQCLLGIENDQTLMVKFQSRDKLRLEFREFLVKNNIELNANKVKDWFISQKTNPSEKLKYYINNDKILNDVWRYYVAGDDRFIDNHNWSDMIKI